MYTILSININIQPIFIIVLLFNKFFDNLNMNKYVVHCGNNSKLFIKPLLDQRGNWVECTDQEAESFKANFIWKPTVYSVRVSFT